MVGRQELVELLLEKAEARCISYFSFEVPGQLLVAAKHSRRDFTRIGAMGLAAQWAPQTLAQTVPGTRRVGYAVIGLGRIAAHFLEGANNSAQSKITALVSGHREKAEHIAVQYGVPTDSIYSYEDFDRIASNRAIEAVYVALPNSMHAEFTIRAAKAGKHVLCEKPMEISSARCVQMIDAC